MGTLARKKEVKKDIVKPAFTYSKSTMETPYSAATLLYILNGDVYYNNLSIIPFMDQ